MGWVQLKGRRHDVWASNDLTKFKLEPHGGLTEAEFVYLETGASLLLIADGGWRTGGRYRLLYRDPGGVFSELQVFPLTGGTFADDPNDWTDVFAKCLGLTKELLSTQTL